MHLDDIAVDFPDMTIIIAHPSWPWQDEALWFTCTSPMFSLICRAGRRSAFRPSWQYANGQLKHKMLFGSDFL